MVVASDMGDSSGVAFYNGSLFIAEIDKVWKIENIEEKLDRGNSIKISKKFLLPMICPQIHGMEENG